jgi:transposase
MIPTAAEVRLTPEDRVVLEARVRAPTTEQRDVFRARIILLADEGRSTRSIARTLGTMPRTVSTWRGRLARESLAGLADKPRPGPTPKYTSATSRRILAVLEREPPAGFARWNGPLIAAEPGDVHEQQVWRFVQKAKAMAIPSHRFMTPLLLSEGVSLACYEVLTVVIKTLCPAN